MTRLVRDLKIAIDLQSLVDRKITETTENLLRHNSWKGALGTVTILSEVFDLYLLVPKSKIIQEEILRWLKAAQIDVSFRQFIEMDQNVKESLLSSSINVTITSSKELAEKLQGIFKVYLLEKKHEGSIQGGIYYVSHWKEIIKDISFFSTE